MIPKINEVAPPGWGHTKAEKEKSKPEKPKSKIGGTAHAMQKAQKRGDIPKNMNIFALMWSMKNKGDKPHYKPGVKDVLKKKYQKEEKADEKPYPPTRLFKNVPNSVVKKANKEADKVKREQEKAVLGEPPKNGPSGASLKSTDNVYEDEKVDMVGLVAQAIQMKEFGLPPATVADKDLGDKINKAHEKEQKRRAKIDAKKKAKTPAHPDAALTKQRRGEEVETEGWGAVAKAADSLAAKSKAREDKSRNKKVSAWAKGRREGVEIDELSKKVLGRYVKQAAHDTAGAGIDLGASSRKKGGQTRADVDKHAGKMVKRQRGVEKAVDKLSKEDMSLDPKGKGRKAAKALYKEITGGIPVSKKMAGTTVPPKQAPRSQRMDKSKNLMPAPGWTTRKAGTKAGQMTTASYDPKLTHFGDVLRQAIAEAKKVDAIKEINKIVKTKTMGKLHGQKVDLFTASAIQQVYKAINHKNKEKMNSVMSKDIHGLLKMADFSMSKMKR